MWDILLNAQVMLADYVSFPLKNGGEEILM